jgi:hypothetical protein
MSNNVSDKETRSSGTSVGWSEGVSLSEEGQTTKGVSLGDSLGTRAFVHGTTWDEVLSTIEKLKALALSARSKDRPTAPEGRDV